MRTLKTHSPLADTADSFAPPTHRATQGEVEAQMLRSRQEWTVRELFRCGQPGEQEVAAAVEHMLRESNQFIAQLAGELAEESRKSRQLKQQLASEGRRRNSELRKCSEELCRVSCQLEGERSGKGERERQLEGAVEELEAESRSMMAEMRGLRQLVREYENQLQRLNQALQLKDQQLATSEAECRLLYGELLAKEKHMESQKEHLMDQHQQALSIIEKKRELVVEQLQEASEKMAEMRQSVESAREMCRQKEAALSHLELQLLKVTGQLAQLEMDTKAATKANQQLQAQVEEQLASKFGQLQHTTTTALSQLQLSYALRTTKVLALLNKALRTLPQAQRAAFQGVQSLLETA